MPNSQLGKNELSKKTAETGSRVYTATRSLLDPSVNAPYCNWEHLSSESEKILLEWRKRKASIAGMTPGAFGGAGPASDDGAGAVMVEDEAENIEELPRISPTHSNGKKHVMSAHARTHLSHLATPVFTHVGTANSRRGCAPLCRRTGQRGHFCWPLPPAFMLKI